MNKKPRFHFLKEFRTRIVATYSFFRAYRKPFAELYQEDILKAVIKSKLRDFQHPCAENEVVLEELVQSIVQPVGIEEEGSRFKRLGLSEFDHLGLIIQKFCSIAAVAAYWELQIKFFAGKAGIEVYRDSSEGEHLETKYIKAIISKVYEKYPKITCDLDMPRDIRNCLLHGNLQQLRSIILPKLSESELESLDPKMVVLNLKAENGRKLRYANDPLSKKEAKEMGPFFWFLSQGNTRLLEFAGRILESSLNEMRNVSLLHALSFDETAGYFDQVAVIGKTLNPNQRTTFIDKRGHHISANKEEVADRLEQILGLFEA